MIDYFSRYVEVTKLSTTTSASVISALKSNFARNGIPDLLISDNGPQYSAKEFKNLQSLMKLHTRQAVLITHRGMGKQRGQLRLLRSC